MKTIWIPGITLLLILCACNEIVQAKTYFEKLRQGDILSGYKVKNVYLNGSGESFGARFIHKDTGFILDLFTVQTVPQGFIWVHTIPMTNMGESHTCEHLLLGKGTKGKYVASLEEMSLGQSTAYTSQLYTAYSFNVDGNEKVFFNLLEAKLDALLHPNFSDEEIQREICHMGIKENNSDKTFKLEEKGTVYTEMVSAFEKPWYYTYRAMNLNLYGKNHPMTYVSGGLPSAIRQMTPLDLRKFHKREYRLSNMGMIASIPPHFSPGRFLKESKKLLKKMIDPIPGNNPVFKPGMNVLLPRPRFNRSINKIQIVDYPSDNENEPGYITYAWPPKLVLNLKQQQLLEIFLYCFADSQTSNMYNMFVNSETRKMDLGASQTYGYVRDETGYAVHVGILNVNQEHINRSKLKVISKMIQHEIKAITGYPDGSNELVEFNDRARNYVTKLKKNNNRYFNSPPGFGLRSGGSGRWFRLLKKLEKKHQFKKSMAMEDELNDISSLLETNKNIWLELIRQWHLLDTIPYCVAAKPSKTILEKELSTKTKRVTRFAELLKKKYNTNDTQQAIQLYKEEYDRITIALEEKTAGIPMPSFVSDPPMTYDDHLDYKVNKIHGSVPMVMSTFNSMVSSTAGIAFRLDCIPPDKLVYIPILTDIITEIGVKKDGKIIPFDEMKEKLKREVLGLSSYLDSNSYSKRAEIVVKGSGENLNETKNVLKWITACVFQPYLEPSNLARIRDVVHKKLVRTRNTMKSSEETWVHYLSTGYRNQSDPLLMTTSCFLTQEHYLHRMKWKLMKVPGDEDVGIINLFLDELDKLCGKNSKKKLLDLLPRLRATGAINSFTNIQKIVPTSAGYAREIILETLDDLESIIPYLPEGTVAEDCHYIIKGIKDDLLVNPATVLKDMKQVLDLLRHRNNSRMFLISNSSDRKKLLSTIKNFVSSLRTGEPPKKQVYSNVPVILNRMKTRYPGLIERPTYVGLVNNGTRNGVYIFNAKCCSLDDTDEEKILDFLAAKMYSGGGAHSIFMKTWQAGLAYSNGIGANEKTGRVTYYAERCPDLAATMRFVVRELQTAPVNSKLANYVVAQVFSSNRSARKYVSRGISMANDLADRYTPKKVKQFRNRVLELSKKTKNLHTVLQNRLEKVYGKVLIGYGPNLSEVENGYYFIIGPEKQFQSLETLISSTEGKHTVYRVYPRDYWITE